MLNSPRLNCRTDGGGRTTSWYDASDLSLRDGLALWLKDWKGAPVGCWDFLQQAEATRPRCHWAVTIVATRGAADGGYAVLIPRSRAARDAVRRWRVMRAYRWLRLDRGLDRTEAKSWANALARALRQGKDNWLHEVMYHGLRWALSATPADVGFVLTWVYRRGWPSGTNPWPNKVLERTNISYFMTSPRLSSALGLGLRILAARYAPD